MSKGSIKEDRTFQDIIFEAHKKFGDGKHTPEDIERSFLQLFYDITHVISSDALVDIQITNWGSFTPSKFKIRKFTKHLSKKIFDKNKVSWEKKQAELLRLRKLLAVYKRILEENDENWDIKFFPPEDLKEAIEEFQPKYLEYKKQQDDG